MRQWIVRDVMTTDVVSVREHTPYRAIVDLLVGHKLSAAPVVDDADRVVGMVSEADLLHRIEFLGDHDQRRVFERPSRRLARTKAHGQTAAELMTAPAVTVRQDQPVAHAARVMETERIKRLPVVDEAGTLVGIVSRRDLLRMHLRPDAEIRDAVTEDVLRRTLWIDPTTVRVEAVDGVVTLRGQLDRRTTALILLRLTEKVPGVVGVVDQLGWEFDDTTLADSRGHRSHPFSAEWPEPSPEERRRAGR